MAAFVIARIFGPHRLFFVGRAPAPQLPPQAAPGVPTARGRRIPRIDRRRTAAAVLVAGSELLLGFWLMSLFAGIVGTVVGAR